MIRIETVRRVLNAEGRFTVKCQLPHPIPQADMTFGFYVDETVLSPEEAANFQSSITVIKNNGFQNGSCPSTSPSNTHPQAAQAKWFSFGNPHGNFNADPTRRRNRMSIMIPLPNVTGAPPWACPQRHIAGSPHTGKRMQGFEALWMPGTDHARHRHAGRGGTPDARRRRQNPPRRRREELVKRIWKWKEVYEARISASSNNSAPVAIGGGCGSRWTKSAPKLCGGRSSRCSRMA